MKYLKMLLLMLVILCSFGSAMAQQIAVRVGSDHHRHHWHHRHWHHRDDRH